MLRVIIKMSDETSEKKYRKPVDGCQHIQTMLRLQSQLALSLPWELCTTSGYIPFARKTDDEKN